MAIRLRAFGTRPRDGWYSTVRFPALRVQPHPSQSRSSKVSGSLRSVVYPLGLLGIFRLSRAPEEQGSRTNLAGTRTSRSGRSIRTPIERPVVTGRLLGAAWIRSIGLNDNSVKCVIIELWEMLAAAAIAAVSL